MQHRKEWPIAIMCDVLEVNRSYYYEYAKQGSSESEKPLTDIERMLIDLFNHHKGNYGSRRLKIELHKKGFEVGRYQIRSLMKKHGLVVIQKPRFKVTTNSNHNEPIADNFLNREFDVDQPNKVWTTDITYLWTHQGWLYVAVVVDLFSRQIIG